MFVVCKISCKFIDEKSEDFNSCISSNYVNCLLPIKLTLFFPLSDFLPLPDFPGRNLHLVMVCILCQILPNSQGAVGPSLSPCLYSLSQPFPNAAFETGCHGMSTTLASSRQFLPH